MHRNTNLLTDLTTNYANHNQPTHDIPAYTKNTTPTPLQRQAYELHRDSHRHRLT